MARAVSYLALHPPSTRGLFAGVLAALLLWFNPAVIWNAHVFPQWDAWILPAYLFAVYFALRNWWLAAGMVIGVAGMGKGQIFLVAPLLLLWPIFSLRFGAALRMVVGVLVGVVAVASPWLLRDERAVWWVIRVTAAIAVLLPVMLGRSSTRKALLIQAGCVVVAAGLILWPWLLRSRPGALTIPLRAGWFPAAWVKEGLRFTERSLVLLLTAGLVAGAKLLPRRATFAWACAGVAAAMCLCVPLFSGSMAWYTVGLAYGTRHWRTLYWCNASNLGAILQLRYGWRWGDYINLADYLPFIHRPWIVPMRYTMIAGYVATLVLCAWGLARKVRWHDRRMLFAIAAPWVLMFALLPQMLDRYLIWAAAFSAAMAALSRGGFVLHVSITAINVIQMAFYMLGSCRPCPEKTRWLPRLAPLHPDIGWAVLALAGVWLYLAITAGRSGLRRSLAPEKT